MDKKKPKIREPNPKQLMVIKGVIQGKTQTQAAIDAGYSPPTASTTGYDIIKKHQSTYLKALVKAGITEDKLAQVHREGLEATKRGPFGVDNDHATRHKFLDSAYKLRGEYAPEKHDVTVKPGLTPEEIEEAKRKARG